MQVALVKDGAILRTYPEGSRIEITAPYWVYDENGDPQELKTGPVTFSAFVGVTYREWSVLAIEIPDPAPGPGQVVEDFATEMVNGVPTRVYTYTDEPWPILSNRQFWKALAMTGLHAAVMAKVDTFPLEDQIEAKQAQEYEHDHWLITEARPDFNLDDAQFRTMWFWAATL